MMFLPDDGVLAIGEEDIGQQEDDLVDCRASALRVSRSEATTSAIAIGMVRKDERPLDVVEDRGPEHLVVEEFGEIPEPREERRGEPVPNRVKATAKVSRPGPENDDDAEQQRRGHEGVVIRGSGRVVGPSGSSAGLHK